jgi:myo-inositol-1(or 4)-monophosphatase
VTVAGTAVGDADLVDLAETAAVAARAASSLLIGARPQDIRAKGNPRDLVTEWDLRSEAVLREVFTARAPGIPVLGEEGGQGGEAGGVATAPRGLRWVVDPIDGTVNFAHGLPIWSVSIALEADGAPVVGVVVAPALGWWFEARRGAGARGTTDGGPLGPLIVTAQDRLDRALLSTGFPYDRATSPDNNFAEWAHLQRRAGACRRLGSASLDLCMVARGWLDGYWERKLKPWDVAAGALIVVEAGGVVTDTRGGPFDVYEGAVVASNGGIHEALVAELGQVRAAPATS